MRVVMLTIEQSMQAALGHKLGAHCEIAAVVLSANVARRRPPAARRLRLNLNRVAARTVGREFVASWQRLLRRYAELYPRFPDVPLVRVANVNDEETLRAVRTHRPGLVVVSGTNLVGRRLIEAAEAVGARIVNLHTGISPYVKGGPNCTNWCLARGSFHLIGNTVMWLDAGIDTGRIIATEQTPLTGGETLDDLHWKVMEHAHDLCVRAVGKLARGESLPSVPQDSIGEGQTFYSAEWGAGAMRRARRNFRRRYAPYFSDGQESARRAAGLKLFPLTD